MKKLNVLAAALVALAPVLAHGQTTTGTLNATAAVRSAVAFTNQAALAFGSITPGTLTTVTAATGGRAMITYNVPALVTVTGATLAGPGGATIAVTLACGQAANATGTGVTTFTCGTGYTPALTANAQTNHYIYVGGTIAAAATSTVAAGNYTGTITLTATYATF